MDTFHGLFEDDSKSNPSPADSPVLMANTSHDKKSVSKQTTEAPCSEGAKMRADSKAHRES